MSREQATPGFWFRLTHALWSLWLLPAPSIALLLAWAAKTDWDPVRSGQTPSFGYTATGLGIQLLAALVVAIVLAALALLHVAVALRCVGNPARSARLAPLAILLALPLAASPILVRVIVPMENPYDGSGSPMAVVISLAFFGVLGVIAALPGGVLLCTWALAEPLQDVVG